MANIGREQCLIIGEGGLGRHDGSELRYRSERPCDGSCLTRKPPRRAGSVNPRVLKINVARLMLHRLEMEIVARKHVSEITSRSVMRSLPRQAANARRSAAVAVCAGEGMGWIG